MSSDLIKEIEQTYMKSDLPQLFPGDTVKVQVRIREGNKERLQAYEGVIIKTDNTSVNKTITVRRVFQGIGIERVFLIHSPTVESISVIRRGDVRRAKLYYLRNRAGKAARIREKTTGYAAKVGIQEVVKEKKKSKKAKRAEARKAAANN